MKQKLLLICLFICSIIHSSAQNQVQVKDNGLDQNNTLMTGFKNPPNQAKARTWWHWISGNVSKSGITADLEAMKQVGIQEAQLFNVHLGFPKGPVKYLSPEWLDLFHFSATEAERLGLELAFHNGAGWSSSGGPWVTPEYAMQKITYSEVLVEGGKTYKEQLPQPKTRLDYYKDIAVLAFPKPKQDVKIDGLDYKNLSGRIRNHLVPDTKEIPTEALIKKEDIIDISSKLSKDGFLEWEVPKGDWVILRLGHTPTGKGNHPAPYGGKGLECDKMSKKALDMYWEGGIQPIINKLGDLIGTTVNNCLIDSYEVGTANWTTGFGDEFKKLRGYSLNSYLPAIAGYYVGSGEITERFLWDFRRTIGDLMAENYYAHFGELCHKNGIKFSVEPYWGPFDNMQVGATGDIVMCEFWSGGYPFFDSPKFVSSIAHLNGSSIVGAESFTGIGGWDEHPAVLKSIGDRAWAQGITRFIFHTYVHQPWDVAPGLALSYHGTDFNRLNTWWNQGKAYMDYIARSQFLLQQGKSVSDFLVFTGESSPNTAFLLPEIKANGYDYDLIGSNKIADLTVKNGQIYTPVGGKYKVLVLPKTDWIKPETLIKIEELAKAGAIIIGAKPKQSPSLEGYPACDNQISEISEVLWGNGLVNDISVEDFLNNNKIHSDFEIEKGDKTNINFIHRKTETSDIYFIANAQKQSRDITCHFRVSGKQPELWNAETGKIKDLTVWQDNGDGTTSVPLQLGMEESVFVIFKETNLSKNHLVKTSLDLKIPKQEPLSNLKIIKAEYGTFLQEGLVDITEVVTNQVKDNKLDILANRMLCDCDPAMGYVKSFRMEYQIGEKTEHIFVEEKEHVLIDGGDKELKILKAVFGKFKPETKGVPKYWPLHDITEKIKNMVASGELEITVDDKLIDNKKPVGNNVALKITFTTDGEERTLFVPTGQELKLFKDISKPELYMHNDNLIWKTPYEGRLSFTSALGKTIEVNSVPKPIELTGSWDISFQPGLGAPNKSTFDELISWSDASNEGIRHFSGTATYKKTFSLTNELLETNSSLELDLGSVAVIAEIILNGKNIGVLWRAPFRINIDEFVRKGKNTLEVKVTNLWPNRLIGDEKLPLDYERKGDKTKSLPDWLTKKEERPTERLTFSSWKHWSKDDELKKTGLLGPVKIKVSKIIEINKK